MLKENFPQADAAKISDLANLYIAEKKYYDKKSERSILEAKAAFSLGIFCYGYNILLNSYNSRFGDPT